MSEIKKEFFKKLDRSEERKAFAVELESEEACRRVASLYSRYVYKWSKRQAYFLTPNMKKEKREKHLRQLKQFIRITSDLGVVHEVYMKAQFEEQMAFLQTRGLQYVPFANLISQKAVERFKKYKERIDASYSTEDARKEEFYSVDTLRIRKAVVESIEKFYDRLERLKELTKKITIDVAIEELEVMTRAKMISNIYIFVSPLIVPQNSEYLEGLHREVTKKLSDYEKKEAKKVRKEALENFEDKEILRYV